MIGSRFKEYVAHYRCWRLDASVVASNINDTSHKIKLENLMLVKSVNSPRKLHVAVETREFDIKYGG